MEENFNLCMAVFLSFYKSTVPCSMQPVTVNISLSFAIAGLQDVGCYFVPRFSRSIGLLEGRTPSVLDDPLTRKNPILKCGLAAQEFNNYTVFAVSIGYCISGSNQPSDYRAGSRSNLCENSVGAVINGNFMMNVYKIQDPEAFRDSAAQIISPSTVAPGGPTDSGVGGVTDGSAVDGSLNGAPVFNANLFMLLSLSLFTIFGIVLQ